MALTGTAENNTASRGIRKAAVVVPIDFRVRRPTAARERIGSANPVTQDRLAEGLRLHREEMRITQALREFRLRLEADLAAGSSIEGGDLHYDQELKIVRRNPQNANVRG